MTESEYSEWQFARQNPNLVRRDPVKFWAFVERVGKSTEQWPKWQQRAADAEFITPPKRPQPEGGD